MELEAENLWIHSASHDFYDTRTSPAGHGGAAGHGQHSGERCGGPQKPRWKIQIPAQGPPHACYKGPKTISIRLYSTQSDPCGGRGRILAHRKHA